VTPPVQPISPASPQKSANAPARAALERAHEALSVAHERLQAARERDPGLCPGLATYAGVKGTLDAAAALLARQTYRVAVAGMMSAGKSTLVNALLRRPGLLPTGIDETTLTITSVQRVETERGDEEGLVVHYLTYEDAVRGVYERGHFQRFLSAQALQKARDRAEPDALRAELAHLVAEGELPDDIREQLAGFLEALEQRRGQLGATLRPSLEDRRLYLAPRTHRDVGHLLLIARAELHVDTELFTREGVELVDLPGADSTNERQQRIVHDYLADTDLLIAVPNAAGFRLVDVDVLRRFKQARGDTKRRVLFVLNRFDEAKAGELATAEAALAYFKKIVDTLARDYDPGNLFFTVALWAGLEERARGGSLPPEDARDLARLRQATTDLAAHFERLGVPETMARTWDERWGPRLAEAIRALPDAGGVDRLRAQVVRYLREQIERERLGEVEGLLGQAADAIEDVVGPERGRVKGFLDSAREQLKATGSYLEQVVWETRAALDQAHADGASPAALAAHVRRLSEQFQAAIAAILEKDTAVLDLRRMAREAGDGSATDVMRRAIERVRAVLSQKFVEFVAARLGGDVARRYQEALEPLDNAGVFLALGRAVDKPDLERRYHGLLNGLERTLHLVTRLRATEETWAVSGLELTPHGDGRPFAAVEASFRRSLTREMQAVFAERFRALVEVLPGWWRAIVDDFAAEVDGLASEALREARLVGARVPVELLAARASPDDRQRYGLAELVSVADAAHATLNHAAGLIDPGAGEGR
jgi:hypothetical protein